MGVLMGAQIGFGRNAERGGASLGFSGLKVLAAWAAGLGFVSIRGILNIQSLNELTSENLGARIFALAMAHPRRASFGSLPFASLSATSLA